MQDGRDDFEHDMEVLERIKNCRAMPVLLLIQRNACNIMWLWPGWFRSLQAWWNMTTAFGRIYMRRKRKHKRRCVLTFSADASALSKVFAAPTVNDTVSSVLLINSWRKGHWLQHQMMKMPETWVALHIKVIALTHRLLTQWGEWLSHWSHWVFR